VTPWPIYEYGLTPRGFEAIEREELHGLKLREMIHNQRYRLASREFFELELERETYRLQRYGRPMTILICRFFVDQEPYALFRLGHEELIRGFVALVLDEVRSLDVAALADARTLAVLVPETGHAEGGIVLGRLTKHLGDYPLTASTGQRVRLRWTAHSWHEPADPGQEPALWFQQQLKPQPEQA
jgi:hypothetical protein